MTELGEARAGSANFFLKSPAALCYNRRETGENAAFPFVLNIHGGIDKFIET